MIVCISNGDGDFFRMVAQTADLVERLVLDLKFQVTVDLCDEHKGSWIGLYKRNQNYIHIDRNHWNKCKNKAGIKMVMHTLCHEIGHAVHFNYLAYKPQYLARKYKGSRTYHCNKDSTESFAECFADYCMAVFEEKYDKIANSKRLSKMGRIINDIINGGYEVKTTVCYGEYVIKENNYRLFLATSSDGTICCGKDKLINPFVDKLKEAKVKELSSYRIDEIGLPKWCSDACVRAGCEYVRDFATRDAISKINVRKIGKGNLDFVLKKLRTNGFDEI